MKTLIALLALSCFGQVPCVPRWVDQGKVTVAVGCVMVSDQNGDAIWQAKEFPSLTPPRSFALQFPTDDSPRIAVDIVNVATLKQLGIPVPPQTTDHIRVTVINLDPAATKITIFLRYFEDGEAVKVERTVNRNEVGAAYLHWVRDAAKITSAAATVEQLAIIP